MADAVDPDRLVHDFKKDELIEQAEAAGVDVKSADTKQDLAEKIAVTLTPDDPLGAAPFTRASMQTIAKNEAAARSLDAEHTAHHVAARLDAYDTWFSRDPGRANGPYS